MRDPGHEAPADHAFVEAPGHLHDDAKEAPTTAGVSYYYAEAPGNSPGRAPPHELAGGEWRRPMDGAGRNHQAVKAADQSDRGESWRTKAQPPVPLF
jgi:hypothetical protein